MNNYFEMAIPVLPCKNVPESVEYYKTKLGFENTWLHEDLYAGAKNGKVSFHFIKAKEDFTPTNLFVIVNNVDELYEFLKSGNVEIETAPVDRFYNMRECIIRDLNGHRITFGEEIIDREPNIPKEN